MGCGSLSTLRASRHLSTPVPDVGPRYTIPIPPSAPIPDFPALEGYEGFEGEVYPEENAWRPYYERQASTMTPLGYSMHHSDLSTAKDKGKRKRDRERMNYLDGYGGYRGGREGSHAVV